MTVAQTPHLSYLQGRVFYRLMSFSCAMAFLIFGYDAGVLGGVQTTKPFLDAMGNPTGPLIIPLIASSYTLGCLAMAIFLTLSDFGSRFGRRLSILMGDTFVIVGGILQSTSYSVTQIIVARVISGLGIGVISATVPTYMSETTISKTKRGPEVAVQCVYLIWGVALAYWVDFGFTRLDTQLSWRFPIALQSFFCLLSFIGMMFLPDTPRWSYSKERMEEGDVVLARLFAKPIENEDVQRQKKEILDSLELEHTEGRIRLTDWFWDRSRLQAARRVRTSFLILAAHQNMGINLLVYYGTVILAGVGLSAFEQQLVAAVMSTVFAIGTIPTVFTIEPWSRRRLMFWTGVGCIITMAIFIAMQGISNKTLATQWIAVACIIVFQFLIGFGWMGVPWLYGPEIAPLTYRHLGGAVGAVGEWLNCFIVVFGGGVTLMSVSWPIWFWQLGSCILACIFVWFWCPETAGRSLEEIDIVFMLEAKVWPECYLGSGQITEDEVRATQAEQRTEMPLEKPGLSEGEERL